MATSAIYRIMPRKEGWIISLFGKVFGPCSSVDDAASAAIEAATKAIERGCKAEVQVYSDERFFAIWRNGAFNDGETAKFLEHG